MGFSVVYTFARLRPMFITAPIPAWALRLIQTNRPMINRMGSANDSRLPHTFEPDFVYLRSTFFWRSSARVASSKFWAGPVAENSRLFCTGLSKTPVMLPLSVL